MPVKEVTAKQLILQRTLSQQDALAKLGTDMQAAQARLAQLESQYATSTNTVLKSLSEVNKAEAATAAL